MHDAFRSVDRPLDDSGSVIDPRMSVAPVDPRGSPLQRAHVVAGGDEFGRDGAAEETRGPGDEHDHGAMGFPPARTRSAHAESRDRSIFEL